MTTSTCNTVAMFDVVGWLAGLRHRPAGPMARGLLALEQTRFKEAVAAFEEAAATAAAAQRVRAHNKCGVALVRLERRDEAIGAFYGALSDDERYAPALCNVGGLLVEDGAPLDALDYFAAAERCDPALPAVYHGLAVALRALGRRAESVRALRTAARLDARRRPEPA